MSCPEFTAPQALMGRYWVDPRQCDPDGRLHTQALADVGCLGGGPPTRTPDGYWDSSDEHYIRRTYWTVGPGGPRQHVTLANLRAIARARIEA